MSVYASNRTWYDDRVGNSGLFLGGWYTQLQLFTGTYTPSFTPDELEHVHTIGDNAFALPIAANINLLTTFINGEYKNVQVALGGENMKLKDALKGLPLPLLKVFLPALIAFRTQQRDLLLAPVITAASDLASKSHFAFFLSSLSLRVIKSQVNLFNPFTSAPKFNYIAFLRCRCSSSKSLGKVLASGNRFFVCSLNGVEHSCVAFYLCS